MNYITTYAIWKGKKVIILQHEKEIFFIKMTIAKQCLLCSEANKKKQHSRQ